MPSTNTEWNADETLGLVDSGPQDPVTGMSFIRWTGSPAFVKELDEIAGFVVSKISAAEHNRQDAFQFSLADEMGARNVGRFTLATDCMHDASLEWTRWYESVEEMLEARDRFLNNGFVRVDARLLMPGDYIRTTKPEERRIELDFSYDGDDEPDEALANWLASNAPSCRGRVVKARGPAGGAPIVEISGPYDAMRKAMIAYSGGDLTQLDDLWVDWTQDEGTVTHVEIVPAEVRGGETGLAVDLDSLTNTFLDMDLDEPVLRRVGLA